MNAESHRIYRRVVWKLLWLVHIRNDLSYMSKELSRTLQSTTHEDSAKLKHATRYVSQRGGDLPHVCMTHRDYELRRHLRHHYVH